MSHSLNCGWIVSGFISCRREREGGAVEGGARDRAVGGGGQVEVWCVDSGTYFTYLLQGRHPRDSQVAVLQEDPGALLLGRFNHADGNWSLALAEGQRAKFGTTKPLKRRTVGTYIRKCRSHRLQHTE